MKLRSLDDISEDGLRSLVEEYREFVGDAAAFHVEYTWAPGTFTGKDEEMDFFLGDDDPATYPVLMDCYNETVEKLAEVNVALIDAQWDRKALAWICAVLALPYAVVAYGLWLK